MKDFAVMQGDCLAVLREMPEASVDAVVTDPPYELAFMGKAWDASGIAYSVRLWREVLRVLKPGGHLLAFGASRTYHRLACGIEDAGFEIRDSIHWIYGSGFPKSLDVSKAIDKQRRDDVRPVCRFLRAAMDQSGITAKVIAERFDFHSRMVDHWAARDTDSQPTVPTWEQWLKLKELLRFGDSMDREVWRLNGRKGEPGDAWKAAPVIGRRTDGAGNGSVVGLGSPRVMATEFDIKAPATRAARRWAGWGSALKPAHEPIVLARKPLSGTIAENVQAYGTGAINVDGTRITSSGGSLPYAAVGPRACSSVDRVALRATRHAQCIQRICRTVSECAPHEVHRSPSGEACVDCSSLARGFPVDCPSCRRSGDELLHLVAADDRAGSPSRPGVRDDIGRLGIASRYSRVNLCTAHRSTWDALLEGVSCSTDVDHDGRAAQGRWPSNVVFSHTPDCVRVGEKRVKGHAGYPNGPGGNKNRRVTIAGENSEWASTPHAGHADADGLETVEAWRCAPGCAARELDRQAGGASRFFKVTTWEKEDRSQGEPMGGTSHAATSDVTSAGDSSCSTSQSGKPSTDPSRPDSKSTISTTTARTTDSRTCSSSIPLRTSDSTADASSETASGGSPAAGVGSSSPSASPTGTSRAKDGRSTGAADRATSPSSSTPNVGGGFVYAAKPAKRERNDGLGDKRSSHPTVKPVQLMRYLVRLVTPPGGLVLDPFCGSGTTGIAAVKEGMRFLGCEKEPEHVRIATARIAKARFGVTSLAHRAMFG